METKINDLLMLLCKGDRVSTSDILSHLGMDNNSNNARKLAQVIKIMFSDYLEPCRFTNNKQRQRGYKVIKPVQAIQEVKTQDYDSIKRLKLDLLDIQRYLDTTDNNIRTMRANVKSCLTTHNYSMMMIYKNYLKQLLINKNHLEEQLTDTKKLLASLKN